jgi:hypothetical protein
VDELAAYERRFRQAGLPLFIEDYRATEDVFTRAAPLLALVFIGEMLGAIDLDWPLLANIAAVGGGLAILLGGYGLLNLARGRPFLALPQDVGWPELAGFVLLPALLPAIFGGQTTSALVTALANLALVALCWGVIGFGLFSIVRWAGRHLGSQLAASLELLARAVPLLLIFAIVLFINTEMWQVFAETPRAFLALLGALVVGLGTLFLVFRLPREVRRLEHEAGGDGPPLDGPQRLNVGLVMFVSQALQVLFVTLSIALFFVVFGALAIGPDVREAWIGSQGNEIVPEFELFGSSVSITEELLRVSGGIAAFSGLYYAIALLTDSTYREEFLEELTGHMRQTFRDRAEYLKQRAAA